MIRNNVVAMPLVLRRRRLNRSSQGLVRDRMSSPAISVAPTARVSRVARILETRRISAVPVVETNGSVIGIISTTDILRSPPADGDPGPLRARDIMVAPVVIAHPDERIDEAAWRMVAARTHRLVVVARSKGEPVLGIISARDMLEELITRRSADPVSDIMTREVATISLGDPIDEAMARLRETNVHGLIVVDGTLPIGMFTHQEALAARRLPPELQSIPVEELMSYETICMDATTPVWRAAAHAMATNVRRLLICENKHLVGIASLVDLVSALARARA